MLKIVDGGKTNFNKHEKELYDNVQTCLEQYDMLEKYGAPRDHSKYYLIMAYNLFDLGLDSEALDIVEKITPEYWNDHFLNDVQEAVNQRNIATVFKMNNDEDTTEYKNAKMEAEFFIVALGIGEYLQDREFPTKKEYDIMDNKFGEINYKFIVNAEMADALEELPEQEDRQDEKESEDIE